MAEVIVLIGMPGSGKTRVGTALAQLLQWELVDTDDLISASLGRDFADFIRSEGIDAARAVERGVVAGLPTSVRADSVVAVGGGTVLHPDNRAVLANLGPIVWLRATPATLLDRVQSDPRDRPLLDDGEDALMALLAQRSPVYEGLATVIVDVEGLAPNEVAVAIIKELSAA